MKISELRQLIREELLTEGYTNYWQQSEDFTSSEWSKIVRLAKATIKKAEKQGIVTVSYTHLTLPTTPYV